MLDKAAGPGRIRGIALELWAAARPRGAAAGGVLRAGLRRARALHSGERRLVQEALYGMIRSEAALASIVGPDPLDLWLGWLVCHGLSPERAAAERPGPWDGLAERLAHAGDGAPPVERLALRHAVPAAIVQRLVDALGPEAAEAFLVASDARAPIDLRPNPRRCDPDRLARRLADDGIPTAPLPGGGLRVEGRANVEGTAAFRDGWFEVQDEGSQRVAALVPPGVSVLDVCAGAGGKSLAFAGAGCRVTALDVRAAALDELRVRAQRAGVRVATRPVPPDRFPPDVPQAEWVVVDAPCTGTGTLRRHPEHRWWWSDAAVREAVERQRALLGRAARLVAPGGRLVYATCSVLADEDEAVASAVDGFVITQEIRTWPQSDRCDGFYAAVLTRA